MSAVSRREMLWAGAWSGGIVLSSLAPLLIAWQLTPPGYRFTGVLVNPSDLFSYLAKMRQAALGAWLLTNPHTAEPQMPALIYPQYVLLGKLAALTGLPMVVVFHGARLVTGMLFLLFLYWFLSLVCTSVPLRRSAFLLIATGSGLSWLTTLFGVVGADADVQILNTYYQLLSNPHFLVSTGLMLAPAAIILASWPVLRPRVVALGSLAGTLLALISPFLLLTQWAVGAAWLALARPAAASLRVAGGGLLLLMLAPAAAALLMAQQLYSNPAMASWMAQNFVFSPSPLSYLIGYGLTVPLAVAGLVAWWRQREKSGLAAAALGLVIAWVVVGALLPAVPVNWQRRMVQGYDIPLGILAAVGLHQMLLPRVAPGWQPLLRGSVIALVALGSLWLNAATIGRAQAVREPHYLSLDDVTALEWLGSNAGSSDVLLASPITGNLATAWTSARAYWGHPLETTDAARKEQQVLAFFDGGLDAAARCRFLSAAGITLVYVGPLERRLGSLDVGATPGLQAAYQTAEASIYRVGPCPGRG